MLRTHQLAPKLKALRLGGMLDTLEMRLQEAQQTQGGYLEFLESLLEDEISRRDNKALALRVQRARFDSVCTLAEFDFSYNQNIPAPQIRDLVRGGYITANQSIIICPVGVGKSHVAQALGHAACQQGSVLYAKTNRLLARAPGLPCPPSRGAGRGTWAPILPRPEEVEAATLNKIQSDPIR